MKFIGNIAMNCFYKSKNKTKTPYCLPISILRMILNNFIVEDPMPNSVSEIFASKSDIFAF